MKKKLMQADKIKNLLFIAIGSIFLFLQSCQGDEQVSVYKPGRIWNFDVTLQDSMDIVIDSFMLKMTTRASSFFEKAIRSVTVEYEYFREGIVFNTETTGIEDNSKLITIHPPRDSYFDITEIVPFPFITKPIGHRFSSSTDMTIQKANFLNRMTNEKIDLAGKRINQEIALVDSAFVPVMKEKLKCYILEGKNLNYTKEFGQFSGRFYFNEKYGFVKLVYLTPWKSKITIKLESVKF